jgi:hypothetical protein
MADQLARLLAPRAGTEPDDPQLRLTIAIALAAEAEALFYWTRTGGTVSLSGLMADALTTIEPVLRIGVPAEDLRDGPVAADSGPPAGRAAADAVFREEEPAPTRRAAGRRPASASETTPLPL